MKLRAHHKVWLVGATFALGSIVVLGMMTARLGSEVSRLATVQQHDLPQEQRLESISNDLGVTRAGLTDAARSPDARERVLLLQRALTSSTTAASTWKQYVAEAPTLPNERLVRGSFDRAATAADQSGPAAGTSIVNAPPGDSVPVSAELTTDIAAVDRELEAARRLQAASRVRTLSTISGERDELTAGQTLAPLAVGIALLIGLVVTALCARSVKHQEVTLRRQESERDEAARRNEFDARLGRALEMAQTEDRALGLVGQALAEITGGGTSAELLLADSSRAHFRQILTTDSEAEGCGVATPADCPAAQRGVTLVFPSKRALDACPHLRELERDCSAACLPVTVGSQAIGVVHVGAPDARPPSKSMMGDLDLVARKAGDRVGMLRAFLDSQSQARTDPLTGLLNRRSLENRVRDLVANGTPYVVAYGDLDHFKDLNDTHGHETGDRSLRLFARVLRDSIRPADIPGRFGGEEFIVVLPDCTIDDAVSVMERVREQLALALAGGAGPSFTASFGVAEGRPGVGFDGVVAEADAALYVAKADGRNRVVRAGEPTEADTAHPAEIG